jgi:hypothetical protein
LIQAEASIGYQAYKWLWSWEDQRGRILFGMVREREESGLWS